MLSGIPDQQKRGEQKSPKGKDDIQKPPLFGDPTLDPSQKFGSSTQVAAQRMTLSLDKPPVPASVYAHVCMCMYVDIYICMYLCTCTDTCVYTYITLSIYIDTHT